MKKLLSPKKCLQESNAAFKYQHIIREIKHPCLEFEKTIYISNDTEIIRDTHIIF